MMPEAFIINWVGTPYKLGGSNTDGVDCWELVAAWHRDVLKREICVVRNAQSRSGCWAELAKQMSSRLEVCKPEDASIVICNPGGGRVMHAGVPWRGGIIHAAKQGVVYDRAEVFAMLYSPLQYGRPAA